MHLTSNISRIMFKTKIANFCYNIKILPLEKKEKRISFFIDWRDLD